MSDRKRFVKNEEELLENCLQFLKLYSSINNTRKKFFKGRIKNCSKFVVCNINGKNVFLPGQYVACHDFTFEELEDVCSDKIKIEGFKRERFKQIFDTRLNTLCGNKIAHESPRYESLKNELQCFLKDYSLSLSKRKDDSRHPLEFWDFTKIADKALQDTEAVEAYFHGRPINFQGKAYSRETKARKACIASYGNSYRCEICKTNLEETYGDAGKEYIHVHHINPLHTKQEEHEVIPKEDLIPVCPNCHMIIHRYKEKLLSPDELRNIIQQQKEKKNAA